MESLHKGVKWLFRVQTYFFIIILLLGFGVPILMDASGLILENVYNALTYLILFLIVYIIIAEIFIRWAYRNWKYEFTKESLKIEKGVIIKKYKSIPYERIQNVDITRGIIARIVGFSTIDIQTAGYSAYAAKGGVGMSEGHIPAVSVEGAEKIREFLMKKITKNKQGL
jgi:membrane protein YdbS with pleckstrin-like domain